MSQEEKLEVAWRALIIIHQTETASKNLFYVKRVPVKLQLSLRKLRIIYLIGLPQEKGLPYFKHVVYICFMHIIFSFCFLSILWEFSSNFLTLCNSTSGREGGQSWGQSPWLQLRWSYPRTHDRSSLSLQELECGTTTLIKWLRLNDLMEESWRDY